MIKYSNKPYLMRKAVFYLCLSLILIWWYPFLRFKAINYLTPYNRFFSWFIKGKGI